MTPGGWWCLPLHSGGRYLKHRLQGLDRRCLVLMWKRTNTRRAAASAITKLHSIDHIVLLSYQGVRWTEQTQVVSWWGVRAPGSRHRGGRFSRRWSWRWSRHRWTERSGERRRPGSGPRDGLWVHHPACDGTPKCVRVYICYCLHQSNMQDNISHIRLVLMDGYLEFQQWLRVRITGKLSAQWNFPKRFYSCNVLTYEVVIRQLGEHMIQNNTDNPHLVHIKTKSYRVFISNHLLNSWSDSVLDA